MLKITKLRSDMNFNQVMGGVLEALKGVASAEYFRLQSESKDFAEFEEYFKDFFRFIKANTLKHPFLDPPAGPKNIVLITSDASFLGKLNMSVVESVFEQYSEGDLLTVVGQQGVRYIEEFKKESISFPGIGDNISHESIINLRDYIIETFLRENLSGTVIVYPHFVSFSTQTIEQLQIFPCRFLFTQDKPVEDRVKDLKAGDLLEADFEEKIIIEPSSKGILEYLIKIWLTRSIHQIFWESKLSEWAARVVHLDKSVSEIQKQNKTLRFQYFRSLHQVNDQNIREIFSNRLVLGKEVRAKERGF